MIAKFDQGQPLCRCEQKKISVLLSASVERFGVSSMRDFFPLIKWCFTIFENFSFKGCFVFTVLGLFFDGLNIQILKFIFFFQIWLFRKKTFFFKCKTYYFFNNQKHLPLQKIKRWTNMLNYMLIFLEEKKSAIVM